MKGVLALRNHNGGYLLIGFNNNMTPDVTNAPANPKAEFSVDAIHKLVGRYASESFEVGVGYPEFDGGTYVVIVVPQGVRTPVAVKADLIGGDGTALLKADDVYVRTLRTNNTPSTAKAGWKDWAAITERMFDNREADIGRFVRRHLSGLSGELVKRLSDEFIAHSTPKPTHEEVMNTFLEDGHTRYLAALSMRKVVVPEHGAWEVVLDIEGEFPKQGTTRSFLQLLDSSNPNLTGWPVWLDSSSFSRDDSRPYVADGAWEALIAIFDGMNHLDFMRKNPRGSFYLRRAYQDDVVVGNRAPVPLKVLDPILMTYRIAETLAVGIAFAKALGCKETAKLNFAFRWTRLQGRTLYSWANLDRYVTSRTTHQDSVRSYIEVPIETPTSALGHFVGSAIEPLFHIFDGFAMSSVVVEDLTRRVIERRM